MATQSDPPALKSRTVLLVATVQGETLIITPASGSPLIPDSVADIVRLVRDPHVPEHKLQAAGGDFDAGKLFRGVLEGLASLGEKTKP